MVHLSPKVREAFQQELNELVARQSKEDPRFRNFVTHHLALIGNIVTRDIEYLAKKGPLESEDVVKLVRHDVLVLVVDAIRRIDGNIPTEIV